LTALRATPFPRFDVGAGIDWPFDDCSSTIPNCAVQCGGGRVVELVACRNIETSPQRDFDAIKLAFGGRDIKNRGRPVR
jgi:hypothetical protein